ncbi:MAG TPA: hypothetical protein VFO19_03145 [Vicinamibacterales bacterium]|nr:hypothetical protein [Vicinamibacterales bacterium]
MLPRIRPFLAACAAVVLPFASTVRNDADVQTLSAVDAVPAHLANQFEDPIAFAVATTGQYLVLDRRTHAVYSLDAAKKAATKMLTVGFEAGRVLSPSTLSLAANDIFAVSDAPNGYERIQFFGLDGLMIGGFYLDERRPLSGRLLHNAVIMSGVGSMTFTGRTFLVNNPDSGALITEFDNHGGVTRHVGTLRRTGHESDRDVHLAMNVGVPLADPRGGFYVVFQAGVPAFRKYDANGQLLFERHIEGTELDGKIQTLPTTWARRETASGRLPLVEPLVRTAAVDGSGRLWISLVLPFTYVYDGSGEKIRTVRFASASGTIAPTSLFFSQTGRLLVTPGLYEFDAR